MNRYRKAAALALVVAGLAAAPVHAEFRAIPVPLPADESTRDIVVAIDKGPRTVDLPRNLRPLREALLNKQELAPEDLKALADRGESLAAAKYAQHLVTLGMKDHASDIAWYSSIAVAGGRAWMIDEFIAAMRMLDPATEPKNRVNQYIRVLYPQAWAGNELALDAVIDLNGKGRLFGALSSSTAAKIRKQVDALASGRADLKLAVSILRKGDLNDKERAEVLRLLESARKSDYLAVSTTAANLIEQLAAKQQGKNPATATN